MLLIIRSFKLVLSRQDCNEFCSCGSRSFILCCCPQPDKQWKIIYAHALYPYPNNSLPINIPFQVLLFAINYNAVRLFINAGRTTDFPYYELKTYGLNSGDWAPIWCVFSFPSMAKQAFQIYFIKTLWKQESTEVGLSQGYWLKGFSNTNVLHDCVFF